MSIFNLKTEIKDLDQSSNCTDLKYSEYLPTKNSVGNAFYGSRFIVPFELSSGDWWIPSRSYLRIRVDFHKKDNAGNVIPLKVEDALGPAYNFASSLFQSMEFQINGETVSKCSQYVAEVDCLENRLSKSKSWMDSVGGSINFLYQDVNKRINMVSSNGDNQYGNGISLQNIQYLDGSLDIATAGGTPSVNVVIAGFVAIVGPPAVSVIEQIAAIKKYFEDNKIKKLNLNGFESQILQITTTATAIAFVMSNIIAIPANSKLNNYDVVALDNKGKYGDDNRGDLIGFECIWNPKCLSIFKYSSALPVGKYQLICTPFNNSGNNCQLRACERPSWVANPNLVNFGTGNNQINVNVNDVRFFCCNVKGDVIDDLTYYIDLEETSCQKSKILTSNNLSKEYFNVSPTTYGLTYAVQNENAGNDTTKASFKFTDGGNELSMNRFYLNYSNKQMPAPDADCSFDNKNDFTTQRYNNTAINCGGYYSEGGWETIEDWSKSPIHYFEIPKGVNDRSTRVVVNSQFSKQFTTANHVLFDHYKNVVQVNIKNGEVVDVRQFDI